MSEEKTKAITKRAAKLTVAAMWDKGEIEAKLKEMYGCNLTNHEWMTFKALSRSANANPFRGEIWSVVFGSEEKRNRKAAIFLGKNQFLKIAHAQPDYDYHRSQAVYENDEFEMTETGVNYKSCAIKERGELLGAFSLAKRKGSSLPNVKWVDFERYFKDYSPIWKSNSAMMIEKVALSQNLKETWYEPFGAPGGGVYIDAEKEIIEASYKEILPEPEEAMPEKTNELSLDIPKLESRLLDKLITIDKVHEYLSNTFKIKNLSQINAMQYQLIQDAAEKL